MKVLEVIFPLNDYCEIDEMLKSWPDLLNNSSRYFGFVSLIFFVAQTLLILIILLYKELIKLFIYKKKEKEEGIVKGYDSVQLSCVGRHKYVFLLPSFH